MDKDSEHLNLLSVFHYVLAALTAVFACIPCLHLGLGLIMLLNPEVLANGHSQAPPRAIGWMFILIGGAAILFGWAVAILTFLAGRSLKRRRRYTFCFVVAAVQCCFIPLGTALGVFTLIVLCRPTVKPLFERTAMSS